MTQICTVDTHVLTRSPIIVYVTPMVPMLQRKHANSHGSAIYRKILVFRTSRDPSEYHKCPTVHIPIMTMNFRWLPNFMVNDLVQFKIFQYDEITNKYKYGKTIVSGKAIIGHCTKSWISLVVKSLRIF